MSDHAFISSGRLPTRYGTFVARAYQAGEAPAHLVLIKGEPERSRRPLVRIHSECLTGDVFGSKRCDCGEQLALSLTLIEKEGIGLLIYLRGHEGRGIGLLHKIGAYGLQDGGLDTVEANLALGLPIDARDYAAAAAILKDLKIASIRLLTNNPAKRRALFDAGFIDVEEIPLLTEPCKENLCYLKTKREKLLHRLEVGPCA